MKEQENSDNNSLYYTGDSAFAPVPMHIGSPPIKPIDKGLIKANAYEAMRHHANQQVDMLRKQAELLMEQVREIEKRVDISRQIYESDIRFVPEVGNTYYLYEHNGMHKLSMIGPNEWGRSKKFDNYIATVKLLADKTWDVIDSVGIKNA